MNNGLRSKLMLAAGIVILTLLIIFFTLRTYQNYRTFESHRQYFSEKNISIEPWMNARLIERQFGIPQSEIFSILNITKTSSNEIAKLQDLCSRNKINCTKAIEGLNQLKN